MKDVYIEDGETELTIGYVSVISNKHADAGLFCLCPLETLYLGRQIKVKINNLVSTDTNPPFKGISTLKSLTIGSNVKIIGNKAFYKCSSLTNVTIPHSVTSLGIDAFRECTALTDVIIGNGVTAIRNYAFKNCSLANIICESKTPATLENAAFEGVDFTSAILKVPAGTMAVYGSKVVKMKL